jgi:hypothetical protein
MNSHVPIWSWRTFLLEGDMTRKQVPIDRENARSIARWEGEGGARKSPSEEETDSREGKVAAARATSGDGGTVIAPNASVSRTWFAQAWEVASDLVLATALIWTLPLLLGAVAAIVRLLLNAM